MVNSEFLKSPKNIVIKNDTKSMLRYCFDTINVVNNGHWNDIDAFSSELPILVVQFIILTALTRVLLLICKRLRLPPFVAELLAGILISTSLLGGYLRENVFEVSHLMIMESLGNFGLAYHLFLMGLEMDLSTISRIGANHLSIGIAGAIFPFVFGFLVFRKLASPGLWETSVTGGLYWGAALSVTGYPAVSAILAELKLLHSELGRTAMSSALVNDFVTWVLLVFVCSLGSSSGYTLTGFLGTIVFVTISYFSIRPAVVWVIRRTTKGEEYSDATICVILTMVMACGLITESIGVSSMVGAFVFGLVIPQQELGDRLLLVLQGFVSDLLMPLFYASVGMRMHIDTLFEGNGNFTQFIKVMLLCFVPKFVSVVAVSYWYKTPLHEGISLGILMSTKNLMALIVLTLGTDFQALSDKAYSFMILTCLIMTITTTPIIHYLHKPTKRFVPSKHRALEKLKLGAELRVLSCVHELQTVPGITKLLSISNATRQSPLCVFALQLIKLTRHTTALLIVHGTNKGGSHDSRRVDGQTEKVIAAFRKLEQENTVISVHPLTAMSGYDTMHEDICSIAEDKRVTFIILPFHKKQTIHNKMEDMNPAYKDVNNNVLANAPCSVGILVDRGIGRQLEHDNKPIIHHIAMIFIGGPDDREALAYASRMANHPGVTLTVLRLVQGENAVDIEPLDFVEAGEGVLSMTMDTEAEKTIDEFYLNDFRHRIVNYKLITYLEKVSNNGAETIAALRSMQENIDLFIVGRGLAFLSPLKSGLDDWSECPELGSIGDLLVTSDFSSTSSVLVIQQYFGINSGRDGSSTPDSSNNGFKQSHISVEPLMKGREKDRNF